MDSQATTDEDLPELEALEAHIRRLQAELSTAGEWGRPQEGHPTEVHVEEVFPEVAAELPDHHTVPATGARMAAMRGLPPLSPQLTAYRSDSPPTVPPLTDYPSAGRGGSSARPDSWHEHANVDVSGTELGCDGNEHADIRSPAREGSGRLRSVSPVHEGDSGTSRSPSPVEGEPDAYDPSSRGNSSQYQQAASVHPIASSKRGPIRGHSVASSTYSTGVVYEAGTIDMGEVVSHSDTVTRGLRMVRSLSPKAAISPSASPASATSEERRPARNQDGTQLSDLAERFGDALSSLAILFSDRLTAKSLLATQSLQAVVALKNTEGTAALRAQLQEVTAMLTKAEAKILHLEGEIQIALVATDAGSEAVVLSPMTPAESLESITVSSASRNPSLSLVSATTITGSASAPSRNKTPSVSVDPTPHAVDRSATVVGSTSRRGSSPSAVPARSANTSHARPSMNRPEPSVRFSIPTPRAEASLNTSAKSDEEAEEVAQSPQRQPFTPRSSAVRNWRTKKLQSVPTVSKSSSALSNREIEASSFLSEAVLIQGDLVRAVDVEAVSKFTAAVSAALAVPAESRKELLAAIEANFGDKLRLAKADIVALREEKLNAIMDSRRQRLAVGKLKEKVSALETLLEQLQKKHAPLILNYNAMQTEYAAVRKRADETSKKLLVSNERNNVSFASFVALEVDAQEQFGRKLIVELETSARESIRRILRTTGYTLAQVLQERHEERAHVSPAKVLRDDVAEGRNLQLVADLAALQQKYTILEENNVLLKANSAAFSHKYLKSLEEIEATHEELATLSQQLGDAQSQNEQLVAVSAINKLDGEVAAASKKQRDLLESELAELKSKMEPLQAEVISARRREAAILKIGSRVDAEAMLGALRGENEKLVGMLRAVQKDKSAVSQQKLPIAEQQPIVKQSVLATPPQTPIRPSLQELASPPNSNELNAHPSPYVTTTSLQPVAIPASIARSELRREGLKVAAAPVVRDIAEDTLDYARQRLTALEDAMLRSASMGRELYESSAAGRILYDEPPVSMGEFSHALPIDTPRVVRASPRRVLLNSSHTFNDSHRVATAPSRFTETRYATPPTAAERGIQGEMQHWHNVVLRTGGQLFPSATATTSQQQSSAIANRPTYVDSFSPIKVSEFGTPRRSAY